MTSHAASHAVVSSVPAVAPAHETPQPSTKHLPWSFRQNVVVRALICVVSGIVVGVCGTLVHRIGAQYNVPIGLLLAWLILMISTWSARARSGIVGLALHLMFSTAVTGFFADFMGDVLLPMGFYSTTLSFFSQYVGWFWLGGLIVVPVIFAFLPRRWFVIANKDKANAKEESADDSDEAKSVEEV
ncbi:alcohol dehydrogenase [Bifidobacterium sp. ESL0682]|uniref:alcohol dehydrogenase n=1 Tax=Bifidobacterium sp. ESL0682 TaxID=2983212 RepID=UPI0023F6F387|nr:alcohol dehydrogenase [Bifidobacterium sp. ESL0682]WEV41543.1 alcohol dehydrogenase [Bifidobacterium sp. ESL0682]